MESRSAATIRVRRWLTTFTVRFNAFGSEGVRVTKKGIEAVRCHRVIGCSTYLDIDEYQLLVHPRIAGHGPTLYTSGLPSTRRLELIRAKPPRSGAVAMRYRRAR